MIFVIPLVFGALGVAAGAVAGALTSHAFGESDRQASKHHKKVADELKNNYLSLEKRYKELADESQQQIVDLTRQRILDVIEKDCLRLALRMRHSLDDLMWDIEREPSVVALKEYCRAVELTNNLLRKLNEREIFIPSNYYVNTFMKAEHRRLLLQKSRIEKFLPEVQTILEESPVSNSVPMSSQAFQEAYDQIQDVGSKLFDYLREFRAERLLEGDDSKGLQAVEDGVNKALKALKNQEYQVAVIAAMKAGKSTFLNALIGADVLASESESCTVCQTGIKPIQSTETPKLFEYREGQEEPILVAEGSTNEIREKFLDRTHQIRIDNNSDETVRFELHHPIEAISDIPSLAGFRLVDTPGPNEWESAGFNTVALKQTTLEALRTCDAILFLLDYNSFRDNTNAELLQDLIEQRREFLENNKGKLYFILNKIDQRSERDREIADVIQDLRNALISFGVPNPTIYPASAWKGLLAKLIENQVATKEHKADFRNFFLARYMQENDDGEFYIPRMVDVASLALQDSGVKTIEESVIQTVVQNSGWHLLNDVLAEFKKAAQAVDENLAIEIRGWEIELEALEQKVEEYKLLSDSSRRKVANVRKAIEEKKQILTADFSQEIKRFSEIAKKRLEEEIEKVSRQRSKESSSRRNDGRPRDLFTYLQERVGSLIDGYHKDNPYKIRVDSKEDAKRIEKTINEFCTPVIQNFWLDTQDKLVRRGEKIREELVQEIIQEIQVISDELSTYIGSSLDIKLSKNPIQFPSFEFSGIDAQVQRQQEVSSRSRKEKRTKKRCCNSDKVYEVTVPYQETVTSYEIDLKQTLKEMKRKIDEQVDRNLALLERVIQKQVLKDFNKGQNQISDYIERFQAEFDYLLKNRAEKEVNAPEVIKNLEICKANFNRDFIMKLGSLQHLLDIWKPTFQS